MSPFINVYVLNKCANEFSPQDVIHLMSYLCSWRKVDTVKILPVKTVCDCKAAEVLHGVPSIISLWT